MAKSKSLLIGGGVIGGIVILGVIAVIVIFSSIDSIIKAAVEEIGPKITQTEVKLDKVDLTVSSGRASLSGLKIGNPAGFTTPHAFSLANISVKIDISTIGEDTIVIQEILIDAPDVIAEFKKLDFNPLDPKGSIQKSMKTSNFIAIQNNVDAFIKKNTFGGGTSTASGNTGEQPKLIIEKFRMNDVKVRVVSHDGLKLDTTLPPLSIALDDIGKKEGGLTPEQITAVLIPKIQDQITKAMTGDLTKVASEMFSKLGGSVKQGLDAATKALDSGAVSGAAKSLSEGAEGATKALKGLFGK